MRILGILFLFVVGFGFLAGCAEDPSVYQGAGLGGAVGAAAGVAVDHHNRWRGAIIGGALGSVFGGGMAKILSNSQARAFQTGQPVGVSQGNTYVLSEPYGPPYSRGQTSCRKVRTRVWQKGALVKDEIREVCEGQKVEPTY